MGLSAWNCGKWGWKDGVRHTLALNYKLADQRVVFWCDKKLSLHGATEQTRVQGTDQEYSSPTQLEEAAQMFFEVVESSHPIMRGTKCLALLRVTLPMPSSCP